MMTTLLSVLFLALACLNYWQQRRTARLLEHVAASSELVGALKILRTVPDVAEELGRDSQDVSLVLMVAHYYGIRDFIFPDRADTIRRMMESDAAKGLEFGPHPWEHATFQKFIEAVGDTVAVSDLLDELNRRGKE